MFLKHTIAAWVWTIVILVLCLLPGDRMPEDPIRDADKIYHAGAFALLSFLYAYGFKKQSRFRFLRANAGWVSIIVSGALGVLIEVLQHYFVRDRYGDWLDALFDVMGAIAGAVALLLICRYISNKNAVSNR